MITATNEDNMIMMARYPDDYFDLAIVDPPYGIKRNSLQMGNSVFNKDSKKWDNNAPKKDYFTELKRISKNQIIWGGNYFQNLPIYNPKLKRKTDFIKVDGIIWDKGETMYGRDFSECEIAFTNLKNGIFKMSPNQPLRIHPTQKPVKLYEWILMNYAKEGDKIVDTHRGSASLDIACHNLGFDLVTCELDTDYFNDGNKRLKQHQNQQVINFEL